MCVFVCLFMYVSKSVALLLASTLQMKAFNIVCHTLWGDFADTVQCWNTGTNAKLLKFFFCTFTTVYYYYYLKS